MLAENTLEALRLRSSSGGARQGLGRPRLIRAIPHRSQAACRVSTTAISREFGGNTVSIQ